MRPRVFIGWDIGGHGGIVVVDQLPDPERRWKVLSQFRGEDFHRKSGRSVVPDLHRQHDLFNLLREKYEVRLLGMEEQAPRPGEGVVSVKTLSACYWGARGLLQGIGLPYVVGAPRTWQASNGWRLSTVSERARELARLHPGLDGKERWIAVAERYTTGLELAASRKDAAPLDGLADAACIALWTASTGRG